MHCWPANFKARGVVRRSGFLGIDGDSAGRVIRGMVDPARQSAQRDGRGVPGDFRAELRGRLDI